MRPLDSTKGNPYLLEIANVFEFRKHAVVEVGFCIKSSEAAIVKLQIKGKDLVRSDDKNFLHLGSPYFNGSILKTACPLTARRQSAISSSW